MLVLAIIAVLVGAGVMKLKDVGTSGKTTATRQDIAALSAALQMYYIDAGRYPTTAQGLKALAVRPTDNPVPRSWQARVQSLEELNDPWQRPYHYRAPGIRNQDYDIWSLGVDGQEGTSDDIGNWK